MTKGKRSQISSGNEDSSAKRKKYLCSFKSDWMKESENMFRRSGKGEQYGFCTLCSIDFSVGHGGKNDLLKHAATANHVQREKTKSNSKSLQTYFLNTEGDKDKAIMSEVIFANFLSQHNIPFSAADHFTQIVSGMFPDSEIARKYACVSNAYPPKLGHSRFLPTSMLNLPTLSPKSPYFAFRKLDRYENSNYCNRECIYLRLSSDYILKAVHV